MLIAMTFCLSNMHFEIKVCQVRVAVNFVLCALCSADIVTRHLLKCSTWVWNAQATTARTYSIDECCLCDWKKSSVCLRVAWCYSPFHQLFVEWVVAEMKPSQLQLRTDIHLQMKFYAWVFEKVSGFHQKLYHFLQSIQYVFCRGQARFIMWSFIH